MFLHFLIKRKKFKHYKRNFCACSVITMQIWRSNLLYFNGSTFMRKWKTLSGSLAHKEQYLLILRIYESKWLPESVRNIRFLVWTIFSQRFCKMNLIYISMFRAFQTNRFYIFQKQFLMIMPSVFIFLNIIFTMPNKDPIGAIVTKAP